MLFFAETNEEFLVKILAKLDKCQISNKVGRLIRRSGVEEEKAMMMSDVLEIEQKRESSFKSKERKRKKSNK